MYARRQTARDHHQKCVLRRVSGYVNVPASHAHQPHESVATPLLLCGALPSCPTAILPHFSLALTHTRSYFLFLSLSLSLSRARARVRTRSVCLPPSPSHPRILAFSPSAHAHTLDQAPTMHLLASGHPVVTTPLVTTPLVTMCALARPKPNDTPSYHARSYDAQLD